MNIIYEDNHIIAVNKKCGEIVQGDKTGDTPLSDMLKAYIKDRDAKPGNVFLGVPHRLDRPTSGVVLFAKTSKALTRLNAMFRNHEEMRKCYWAIVKQCPPNQEGELEDYLFRNEKQNKSYVCDKNRTGAQYSALTYKVIAKSEQFYLLEIILKTGRHHQIRCQLANMGCPIKGDLKYGYNRSNPDGGISLHARSIDFVHPVSKKVIHIEAPVPNDKLWHILENGRIPRL